MKHCATCGTPIEQGSGRGRPRLYCNRSCYPKRDSLSRGELTCACCGKEMWWSATSLPQGQATCLPCRRILNPKPEPATAGVVPCKTCQRLFEQSRVGHVYCTYECRPHRWGKTPPRTLTAEERGYGTEHRRLRAEWKGRVEAGGVDCGICGDPIPVDGKWHLDHTPDRTGYRGPAHAVCNVRDAAVRRNRAQARGAPIAA